MNTQNLLPVTVYSKPGCQPCAATKRWLADHGIRVRDIDVSQDPDAYQKVVDMGYAGVPVVVVPFDYPCSGGHHWQGFNPFELENLLVE